MKNKLNLQKEIKNLEEKKLINKIIELGSLNDHNYDTTKNIFGSRNILESKEMNIQNLKSNWNDNDSEQGFFQEFVNETNMPDLLQDLYYEIPYLDTELYMNHKHFLGYTFFSLKKLYQNPYFQNKFCDFATKYCGMGGMRYFEIISWRFSDGKCFRRIMGGPSNYYNNSYNEEWVNSIHPDEPWTFKPSITNDSLPCNYYIKDNQLFNISEFFNFIIELKDTENNKKKEPIWEYINN